MNGYDHAKAHNVNIIDDNQKVNGHNQSTWSTYVCKYSYIQPTPMDPKIQKKPPSPRSPSPRPPPDVI